MSGPWNTGRKGCRPWFSSKSRWAAGPCKAARKRIQSEMQPQSKPSLLVTPIHWQILHDRLLLNWRRLRFLIASASTRCKNSLAIEGSYKQIQVPCNKRLEELRAYSEIQIRYSCQITIIMRRAPIVGTMESGDRGSCGYPWLSLLDGSQIKLLPTLISGSKWMDL